MRDAYPFGLFAVPRSECVRVHASSGTTGQATVVGYTKDDLQVWGDCFARGIYMLGGGEDSVVQVSYGYGLFTGGLGAHFGAEAAGAMVVPMSTGNTKRQIQIMKDFGVTILCATPSYALLIADTIAEMGMSMDEFKLTGVIVASVNLLAGDARRIRRKRVQYCDVYGLSEIMGPGVAMECSGRNSLHLCEDQFLAEIVNPDTFEPATPFDGPDSAASSLPRSRASVPRSFAIARATLRASFRASAPASVRIRKSTASWAAPTTCSLFAA